MRKPLEFAGVLAKLLGKTTKGPKHHESAIYVATSYVVETLLSLVKSKQVFDVRRLREAYVKRAEAEADIARAEAKLKLAEATDAANRATREMAQAELRRRAAEAAKTEAQAERISADARRIKAIAKLTDSISRLRQEAGEFFLSADNLERLLRPGASEGKGAPRTESEGTGKEQDG
jgi:membrane protein involved in colicin uptake